MSDDEKKDTERVFTLKVKLIILAVGLVFIGIGMLGFIVFENEYMVKEFDYADLTFSTNDGMIHSIRFILLEARDSENITIKENIYVMEEILSDDCKTCKFDGFIVKVIYKQDGIFWVLNKLGVYQNFKTPYNEFIPVEEASLLLSNGDELLFTYDQRLNDILAQQKR